MTSFNTAAAPNWPLPTHNIPRLQSVLDAFPTTT